MPTHVAVAINVLCALLIAKIGYDFVRPFNAESRPVLKAVIAVALYFATIFILPFDVQLVFGPLSIGFAIGCARIAIRQTRAQMAAENAFMAELDEPGRNAR